MDYTKLTIAALANGISKTEAAIRRCREILDDLQEPKTVGMQAVVKAIRDLLPKLEEDLKALGESLHPRHQAQRLGTALNATSRRARLRWRRSQRAGEGNRRGRFIF